MKKAAWVFIIVILVFLIICLIRHPVKQTAMPDSGPASASPAAASANSQPQYPLNAVQIAAAAAAHLSGQQNDRAALPVIAAQYNQTHNVPIDFFGLVIDQDSNPVPGVTISIAIRQSYMSPSTNLDFNGRQIPMEKETGGDGRFEISGESGDAFDVKSIEKTGYDLSAKTMRSFGTSGGSFESPVIFKMWKRGAAQHLISYNLSRIGIPVDGSAVQFDLLNGKVVSSGGQLTVRVMRNPQSLPPDDAAYDWSAAFEIPGGGLVTNSDEFQYNAPESGYQEAYEFNMPKEATNWSATMDQQFYIQLENGKYYGSVTVHLPTFHNVPPIGLNLGVTINQNGSRSLQP